MKKLLFSIILVLATLPIVAQQVDSVSIFSDKMQREIKNVVVRPADYNENKEYPVIYLLHGYGGNQATWLEQSRPSLTEDATKYQVIFVSPDGQNSWYWDSPINPDMQFETYVSKELVDYIDNNYSTIKSPEGRAITGFSMGGHGALWVAINHQDVFGACGSLSGGVDIRPFPNSWEMKRWLGKQKDNPEVWENHTVINQLHKIEPNSLPIVIDCGFRDFFFPANEELHKKMMYMNIGHDYYTRPGTHTHEYWGNVVEYQFVFFRKFFDGEKMSK